MPKFTFNFLKEMFPTPSGEGTMFCLLWWISIIMTIAIMIFGMYSIN